MKSMDSSQAQQSSSRSSRRSEACMSWETRKKAMITIKVRSQLGGAVVSREHGERMRHLLEKAISQGSEPVVVDFSGMQITSVSFFDESFGVLARQYGEDL